MFKNWQDYVASAVFTSATITWAGFVNSDVPVPYLDEYFHVPQAQKYCKGDYTWDPKITTPPGLYLVAKLFSPIFGCSTKVLRLQNALSLSLIFFTVLHIRRLVQAGADPQQTEKNSTKYKGELKTEKDSEEPGDLQTPTSNALTAFNIASFPPLFFFGGLYYTDVMSTTAVLLSYQIFLKTAEKLRRNIIDDLTAVSIGIVALCFRQTNIFWVAVFPAGLSIVEALEKNSSLQSVKERNFVRILQESWKTNTVYDSSVYNAGLLDVVIFVLTIVPAILRKPIVVLRAIFSYILLLVLFGAFVTWNGGVVLGDKSAHTATIHVPQMLYIWPYIALFSAPILLGPLSRIIGPFLPLQMQKTLGHKGTIHDGLNLPSLLPAALFIAGGLAAVHFNTIIHPYTLADNRHYVFYVFRILLRHPMIKYFAVPVYYVCAYLTIQSLGSPPVQQKIAKPESRAPPIDSHTKPRSCQISFVVVWLATAALSVLTAPLVEPRYFIIPWIIWRLHVPYIPSSFTIVGRKYSQDLRLVIETIWLLTINQVVQYLFLYRVFTWPSEPGNKQRFLW